MIKNRSYLCLEIHSSLYFFIEVKTTIMKMIMGVEDYQEGGIAIRKDARVGSYLGCHERQR